MIFFAIFATLLIVTSIILGNKYVDKVKHIKILVPLLLIYLTVFVINFCPTVIISYVIASVHILMLGAFLYLIIANLHIHEFKIFLVGHILNLAVIVPNYGLVPVTAELSSITQCNRFIHLHNPIFSALCANAITINDDVYILATVGDSIILTGAILLFVHSLHEAFKNE